MGHDFAADYARLDALEACLDACLQRVQAMTSATEAVKELIQDYDRQLAELRQLRDSYKLTLQEATDENRKLVEQLAAAEKGVQALLLGHRDEAFLCCAQAFPERAEALTASAVSVRWCKKCGYPHAVHPRSGRCEVPE